MNPAARRHAIARVLDNAPVRRRRLIVWALAASGIGLDGYDLFIMSVAGPLIVADLGLSDWQDSVAVGAAVLGAVPGALLSGRIADRIGRRAMLKIDLILFIATAIASAFAWDVWSLAIFRFLQGAAVGAEYPLSASMVSEVMPAKKRGVWMTGAFSFQAVGMVLGAGVGFLLLTWMPYETTWRLMLLSGVVPAVIVAVLRLRIPESPRWEAERGNLDQAEQDTEWLTGERPVVTDEDRALAEVFESGPQPRMTYKDLWAPIRRRALILTTVPWFLMDIALYGIGLFTPTILAGLSGADSNTHMAKDDFIAADITATAQAAFTDLFLIVGFVLNMLLVERAGRIRLQIVGFIGMAFGLGTLAVIGTSGPMWVMLGGFIMFNTMVNLGPNATTYLLPAEVFPTRLRATGHGVAAAAGKVGAVVGTFFLPLATSAFGLSPTVGVIAIAAALGAIVTYRARIETRGKELRD
ncbi:MAG: MFS transporter [Actinomycetota bacterium]|nr:MFS transporter [Actinomycetota bacterium]